MLYELTFAKKLVLCRVNDQKLSTSFKLWWKQNNRSSHHRSGSVKNVFLEMPQNSQENTCVRHQSLFFNKVGLRPATLLKKRLWHRCFPESCATFLRTPFLQNTSGWLLLKQPYTFSHARSREKWNTDIRFWKVISRIWMYLTSLWDKTNTSSHGLKS